MNIFEIFKFLPKPAVFVLPVALAFFTFAFFSFFKKGTSKKKGVAKENVSLAAAFKEPPPPKKKNFENLLLILTILLLLLSLPLALLLVSKKQEIRMKAEVSDEITPTPTEELSPTPEELSPSPTPWSDEISPTPSEGLSPTPSLSQCDNIKIYDEDWLEIERDELPNLKAGQTIRITVSGDPAIFDKGRIRINTMTWSSENETSSTKPDSPGEFYIECQVEVVSKKATVCGISANLDDTFKIEAELHDKNADQWR